ncbi:MAG: GAF domain-containing protein [Chloroherpetonaceae bacterium]|nr:GAF domain-containing protein [Chloroherpetonaceae bacterium]
MFETVELQAATKSELYKELTKQLYHLIDGERDFIANASNFSSLLFNSLPDLNWAGFYIYKEKELVLGPFQGKPACVRIAIGKGVCGTAAERLKTVIVKDVHSFPGHIACDAASNSEIVVPMIKNGVFIGVLDLDSPLVERFDEEDKAGLENLVEMFLSKTDIRYF